MSKIGQKVLEIEETTGKSVEEIAQEELEDKVNEKGVQVKEEPSAKLVKLGAIIPIPNQSYSDIRPEVEATDSKSALKYIEDLARMVGNDKYADAIKQEDKPTKIANEEQPVFFQPMGGGRVVRFFEKEHAYFNMDGKRLLSGSKFASSTVVPFNNDFVASKIARDGLSVDAVLDIWDRKNKIACDFGSAIHEAMDAYQKYNQFKSIMGGEDRILPNSGYIADLVRKFFTPERCKEQAVSEVFVSDDKYCGQIDRLVFQDEATRSVIIQDYKTNDIDKSVTFRKEIRAHYADVPKNKYGEYMFQLSLYAKILKEQGYNVKECQLVVLNNDEWEIRTFKPLNVDPALEAMYE